MTKLIAWLMVISLQILAAYVAGLFGSAMHAGEIDAAPTLFLGYWGMQVFVLAGAWAIGNVSGTERGK
jgi:hypothetical protein